MKVSTHIGSTGFNSLCQGNALVHIELPVKEISVEGDGLCAQTVGLSQSLSEFIIAVNVVIMIITSTGIHGFQQVMFN